MQNKPLWWLFCGMVQCSYWQDCPVQWYVYHCYYGIVQLLTRLSSVLVCISLLLWYSVVTDKTVQCSGMYIIVIMVQCSYWQDCPVQWYVYHCYYGIVQLLARQSSVVVCISLLLWYSVVTDKTVQCSGMYIIVIMVQCSY